MTTATSAPAARTSATPIIRSLRCGAPASTVRTPLHPTPTTAKPSGPAPQDRTDTVRRLPNLDLRQLTCFVAVAEQHGFTAAAKVLFIGQPALSAQVQRLERHLRVTLFVRGTRKVELTAAGRALLPRALALLDDADRAEDVVRSSHERRGAVLPPQSSDYSSAVQSGPLVGLVLGARRG